MKFSTIIATLLLCTPATLFAQRPRAATPPPQPPKAAKEAAPVDLTGYWVSVVSEDWRWRMVTPVRGDFQSIPLNAEGKRVGLTWDPDADAAAGEQCRSYGAPALMRIPGRVRITWADNETLKIETDAGTQTRLLKFTPPQGAVTAPSWQGDSVANWERPLVTTLAGADIPVFASRIGSGGGSLEVVTTNLRPGYLRKNGPPYSANAKLREFFDYHVEPNGDQWFTVTTVVDDPAYLNGPFITSSDFKKQPNSNGWDPSPCSVK